MGFLSDLADGIGRAINPAAQARHERARDERAAERGPSQPGPRRRAITTLSRGLYKDGNGERGYIRRLASPATQLQSRRSYEELSTGRSHGNSLRSGTYHAADVNRSIFGQIPAEKIKSQNVSMPEKSLELPLKDAKAFQRSYKNPRPRAKIRSRSSLSKPVVTEVKTSPLSARVLAPKVGFWKRAKNRKIQDGDYDTDETSSSSPVRSRKGQSKTIVTTPEEPKENEEEERTYSDPPIHQTQPKPRRPAFETPTHPIPGAFVETLNGKVHNSKGSYQPNKIVQIDDDDTQKNEKTIEKMESSESLGSLEHVDTVMDVLTPTQNIEDPFASQSSRIPDRAPTTVRGRLSTTTAPDPEADGKSSEFSCSRKNDDNKSETGSVASKQVKVKTSEAKSKEEKVDDETKYTDGENSTAEPETKVSCTLPAETTDESVKVSVTHQDTDGMYTAPAEEEDSQWGSFTSNKSRKARKAAAKNKK